MFYDISNFDIVSGIYILYKSVYKCLVEFLKSDQCVGGGLLKLN